MRKVYDEVRASHATRGNPTVLIIAENDADDVAMVALTLAAVAATTQRVLLIDADLQRRTLAALDAEVGNLGLVVSPSNAAACPMRWRKQRWRPGSDPYRLRGAGKPPRPPHLRCR